MNQVEKFVDGKNLTQAFIANNANLRGQMQSMISTALEDYNTSSSPPIRVNVPVSAWTEDNGIYVTAISGLTLDVDANYDVVFDTSSETMTDEAYISLTSCFITPSSYDAATLHLKALLNRPLHDFGLYLIKN